MTDKTTTLPLLVLLRNPAGSINLQHMKVMREAADEIERLRCNMARALDCLETAALWEDRVARAAAVLKGQI